MESMDKLPARVQQLLEQRATHRKAMAEIDAILEQVDAALEAQTPNVAKLATSSKAKAVSQAGRAPITANQFVLEFVKKKKNPTSKEINAAWKGSGRKRTADITLSQLTKAKKLTRRPLGVGIRGSRYAIVP